MVRRRRTSFPSATIFITGWILFLLFVSLSPLPPQNVAAERDFVATMQWVSDPSNPVFPLKQTVLTRAEAETKTALKKPVPKSISDLRAIESQLKKIVNKIRSCTVGIRIGRAQGSGVIVSKDGYVLSAAHVTSAPGHSATLILPDGREVQAMTLGLNRTQDTSLLKIVDEAEWPFAEMGDMKTVQIGNWCVATGHPGGFKDKREPVVRFGRVIKLWESAIQTDCTLVGGDSGGPLFDMQGRVIGINSRIGVPTNWNFHVPIDAYQDGWERMVASDVWGSQPSTTPTVLGVSGVDDKRGPRVTDVSKGLPAESAGIQPGDIISKFNGRNVKDFDVLADLVRARRPGDEVTLTILRNEKTLKIKVTLEMQP